MSVAFALMTVIPMLTLGYFLSSYVIPHVVTHENLILIITLNIILAFGGFILMKHEVDQRYAELGMSNQCLGASENQYRELFNATPDGIIVHDANGVILDANDVTARNLETTRSALIGRRLAEFVTSANVSCIGAHAASALSGREQIFETTYVSASGKTTQAEVHEHRIQWKGGDAVLSSSRDISERIRADAALRESEVWLKNLTLSMAD